MAGRVIWRNFIYSRMPDECEMIKGSMQRGESEYENIYDIVSIRTEKNS